jgi:hypothetical protein
LLSDDLVLELDVLQVRIVYSEDRHAFGWYLRDAQYVRETSNLLAVLAFHVKSSEKCRKQCRCNTEENLGWG